LEKLRTKKMKAIILAAGMGTRLGHYTQNLPKCMLNFNGKTLIQRQIETLKSCGINDITIVKGYMPDKIEIAGTKTYLNHDYSNTNMVETLFCAEAEMDENEDLLVCYADIIYEPKILHKVLASNSEIGVVVDEDYWEYWSARSDNPEDDMESLIVNEDKIVELGNTNCHRDEAKVRYVGLIKFSKEGIRKLKKVYHENKEKYFSLDQPWLRSKSFKKAYMTCMLQALINSGQKVEPIVISRGWMEFDTVEDYDKAVSWTASGELKRFINLG